MDPLRATNIVPSGAERVRPRSQVMERAEPDSATWRTASPWLTAPTSAPTDEPRLPEDHRDTRDSDARLPTPKPTWKQRAWTLGRRVMLGAMLGGSIISAIGFHANKDALHVSVSKTLDDNPQAPKAPTAPATPAPAPHTHKPAGLVVLMPADTLQDVSRSIQTSPRFQSQLQHKIDETRTLIQARLKNLPPIDRQELLDLEAPLPTGERPFLHVGSVDLPSAGVKALQSERIPVAVKAHAQAQGLPVRVEIQRVEEHPEGPPGAVYLGSYRTTIHAEAPIVQVEGRVDLLQDLDGALTREALQDHPAAKERLEARLAQGQKLQNLSWALKALLADQGATFQREVRVPQDRPLVEGVHHLWLGPDVNADGKADLVVTESLTTPGIDALKLEPKQQQAVPHAKTSGWALEKAHDAIASHVQDEVAVQLDAFATQLPARTRDVVRATWTDAARALQSTADEQLQRFYQEHAVTTVPVAADSVKASIGCVLPTGNGLCASVSVDVHGGDPGDATRYIAQPELIPASVRSGKGAMVAVSGDTLNAALRDVRDGGSVDWMSVLHEAATQKGLQKLEFNKDADGKSMTPRLTWSDGRPFIAFEVTAQVAGFKPVGTATGVVSGATGLIDGGAGALQDGLEHVAGTPGKVVGAVTRSPFWLIDKVVGGVKGVVDNTVGVVVDTLPEAGTRPVASVRIEVPLRLDVRDGVLIVGPSAEGVRIGKATGASDSLMLPTNVIQSLIAQSIAEASHEDVGKGLGRVQLPVDLQQRGVRFEAAEAGPSAKAGVPDLFLRISPTPALVGQEPGAVPQNP